MALEPAITALEQLKDREPLSQLLAWKADSVQQARFDRGELTIWIPREIIRDVLAYLRDEQQYNYLADITCVDRYPSEPRFDVVYHLLSIPKKMRVRLKVQLHGGDPNVESVTSVFAGANYFEREVFDLFGIRFSGHPNMIRILMPDDWEGHPLRKDYPVEGYR